MALIVNITRDEGWFLGEDKRLSVAVYADRDRTVPLNVTGMAMSWKLATAAGVAAAVTKTTGGGGIAITGVFNADPALNSQRVEVTVDDNETDALAATTWWHELKRTDPGLEAILVHGSVVLLGPVHTP